MLSILVLFFLLDFASSNIEFLKPSSGQEFPTNESIQIKWKKVGGASNYSINGNSSAGINIEAFKAPTRCKPRISIGPLQEGYWDVLVEARNQSGDVIDSGWISFRVCQSLPCPNGTEIEEDCPSNQVQRYYMAPGYQVNGKLYDGSYTTNSEQVCLGICTNNAYPNGDSIQCKSVRYTNQSTGCRIYSTVTYPQGNATLRNVTTSIYYEKVCINATFGDRCPGPFFVEPERILNAGGWYATVDDINACLEQCINSRALYSGYACRSGAFFTMNAINNCLLFVENRTSIPNDYMQRLESTYFELGCV